MLSFAVSISSTGAHSGSGVVDQTFIDREIEIIYRLGQEVLQYEDLLTKASDICGELDRLT